MTDSSTKTDGKLPDWELEFARLIAFPTSSSLLVKQNWWRELVPEVPNDFTVSGNGTYQDWRGTFEGKLLALTITERHVVWEVRSPALVGQSGYFPTVGRFQEQLRWFLNLMSPWLGKSCPPVARIAFSAKLLHATTAVHDTYRILGNCLPAIKAILDPNPNDFALQINRRKASGLVPGLAFNRFSTWAKMNLATLVEPGRPLKWNESGSYCTLELDVNTPPEYAHILPRERLPELFRELAESGIHLAEYGDTDGSS
jgi:hypothetical protein